jgi:hypothetical protein
LTVEVYCPYMTPKELGNSPGSHQIVACTQENTLLVGSRPVFSLKNVGDSVVLQFPDNFPLPSVNIGNFSHDKTHMIELGKMAPIPGGTLVSLDFQQTPMIIVRLFIEKGQWGIENCTGIQTGIIIPDLIPGEKSPVIRFINRKFLLKLQALVLYPYSENDKQKARVIRIDIDDKGKQVTVSRVNNELINDHNFSENPTSIQERIARYRKIFTTIHWEYLGMSIASSPYGEPFHLVTLESDQITMNLLYTPNTHKLVGISLQNETWYVDKKSSGYLRGSVLFFDDNGTSSLYTLTRDELKQEKIDWDKQKTKAEPADEIKQLVLLSNAYAMLLDAGGLSSSEDIRLRRGKRSG